MSDRDFKDSHPYAFRFLSNADYSAEKGVEDTHFFINYSSFNEDYDTWKAIEKDGISFYRVTDTRVEIIVEGQGLYNFALENATYEYIEDEDSIWHKQNKMTLSNEAYKSLHIDSNDTKTTK